MPRIAAAALALLLLLTGCSQPAGEAGGGTASDGASPAASEARAPSPPQAPTGAPTTSPQRQRRPPLGTRRPAWLGRRVLPKTDAGYGEIRPTPRVLRHRRFPTIDVLPPPASKRYRAAVSRVPDHVLARSTWSSACPVARRDLRYLTLTFHGFDGQPHTGELLVHADAAGGVKRVFRELYRARYPIEEMRVVDVPELDLPPTGDGNNTTAFVCRPSRGSTSWSQHAYGRAIDVNPFFNPYVRGDVVLPELASYFKNRQRRHPGIAKPDGPAVEAFASIGWEWGGSWSGLKDYMHFSANGR